VTLSVAVPGDTNFSDATARIYPTPLSDRYGLAVRACCRCVACRHLTQGGGWLRRVSVTQRRRFCADATWRLRATIDAKIT